MKTSTRPALQLGVLIMALTAMQAFALSIQIREPQLQTVIDALLPRSFQQEQLHLVVNQAKVSLFGPDRVRMATTVDIASQGEKATLRITADGALRYHRADNQIQIVKPRIQSVEQLAGSEKLLVQYQTMINDFVNKEFPVIFLVDMKQLGLPSNIISTITVVDGGINFE